MKSSEKLYKDIIECCINEGEEVALNTIVTFLTNLRGDENKINWLKDCLDKIGKY